MPSSKIDGAAGQALMPSCANHSSQLLGGDFGRLALGVSSGCSRSSNPNILIFSYRQAHVTKSHAYFCVLSREFDGRGSVCPDPPRE